MQFTDIFIKKPVLASVVSLLILLLGLRAVIDLPLRQFPKMENTVITVSTAYSGASAELMQGFITSPIQKAIASADGIDYMTAESNAGISTVKVHIKLNYDPNIAMTDIMAKTAEITNALPKESDRPVIEKSTGSQTSLMYISFTSPNMNTQQITDYISRIIQPKLQTAGGVANAAILGGGTYAMRIWLDTKRMNGLHISAEDVVNALKSQNFQATAGQIKGKFVVYDINAKTDLNEAKNFGAIVVKNNNNTFIRLQDIATVELGAESYDSSVSFNEQKAVFVGIEATPTANPLTVINEVKKLLPGLAINYPPGLQAKIVYDSTDYIRASIHEVIRSITESTLIVILVVFLFLGAFRAVIIPIVTIPLSLIGVCSLLYAMGYSLNLLTLLAMVLAIGLVVDDAIVVVENIYRHMEEGLSPIKAALLGAKEIASPIISMTTTLAAVYTPIGFMSGITGALFKEFAFTLALAVILSGVIALTLSPMMCSKLLSKNYSTLRFVQWLNELFERLKIKYINHLQNVLHFRKVGVVFCIIMTTACALLARTTASELAPTEDKSVLFISATAPEYANINYLTKYTDQFNKIFKAIPATKDYFIINGMGQPNNAFAGLILKPWDERTQSQAKILKIVQEKLSHVAGLSTVAFPLPSIPGTGGNLPIQFVLTTTADFVTLFNAMQNLLTAANQSGLFMFVDSDLKFEKPELTLHIDRNKAAALGINIENIASTLSTFLSEGNVNRFSLSGDSYEVIPEVPQSLRYSPQMLSNYYVKTADGKNLIPLKSITSFNMTTVPNQLSQFQQLNSATLQGLMMPGQSIMAGLHFLMSKAQETLPNDISYDFAGQSRQAIKEGSTMLYTFFFALIIIYLVLSAQFESFRDPLIVLISVPLSIAGALIPLNLGIATLNIYTGIGLITLIGLISKHGILLVEFANQLQDTKKLSVEEAIIESASLRLRPILMTTAAMILGVMPLIFASGAGAKSRFDIGLVIASGMLVGTCFTLFIVPTMYTLITKNKNE